MESHNPGNPLPSSPLIPAIQRAQQITARGAPGSGENGPRPRTAGKRSRERLIRQPMRECRAAGRSAAREPEEKAEKASARALVAKSGERTVSPQ